MIQGLRQLVGIKNKDSLKSTDGSQDRYRKTIEPIIPQTAEIPTPLFKEEELRSNLCASIYECYPDIVNLTIHVEPSKKYIGKDKYSNIYYLTISWENGVSECLIYTVVDYTIDDYIASTDAVLSREMFKVSLMRLLSENVILKASKKYANCIAPNLPINSHNVHCFKLGGVSIYELAKGELRLMDEVK